jgi:hypothetical protein
MVELFLVNGGIHKYLCKSFPYLRLQETPKSTPPIAQVPERTGRPSNSMTLVIKTGLALWYLLGNMNA